MQPVVRAGPSLLFWVKLATSKLARWRRIGALDMILLQVIHGLAHGEHAGSSTDAKQLARFAGAVADMIHASHTGYKKTWAGEKLTLDANQVTWLRNRVNFYLPHAALLTYEERERLIRKLNWKASLIRTRKERIYWADHWGRRKQLVLLRALEAEGRATTNTPLAHFLCRVCPELLFRDVVAGL